MSDDDDKPDATKGSADEGLGKVIRASFGAPDRPEAKLDYQYEKPTCYHRHFEVYCKSRVVKCGMCGKQLDPFDLLQEYAERERSWRYYEKERRETSQRIEDLRAEEQRIKARIRNANKHDAKLAVLEERKRTAYIMWRANSNARQIIELAKRIERATSGRIALAETPEAQQEGGTRGDDRA